MKTKLLLLAALVSASAMGEQSEIDKRTEAIIVKAEDIAARDFHESAALMILLQHRIDAEVKRQVNPLVKSGEMTEEQSWDALGRVHAVMMHYSDALKWQSVFECHFKESDYYMDLLMGFETKGYPKCRESAYRHYEERARPALSRSYRKISKEANELAREIVSYNVDISW